MVAVFRRALPLLSCLALLGACGGNVFTAIKPSELPKVTGPSSAVVVQGPNASRAVALPVRQVETPDGRLIEVEGNFDVVITTADSTWTFSYPVAATLQGQLLEVKSKNLPPVKLDLRVVRKVELKQSVHGEGTSILLGVGVLAAVVLLISI